MTSEKNWAQKKLEELCQIPSIAFPGFPATPVVQSAQHTAAVFKEAGFPLVEVWETPDWEPGKPGAPAVFAHWPGDPQAPTLLLYAHHDVQPPMREALWNSPPFEPTERQGRLYARGAADDKAGILIHAASVQNFRSQNPSSKLNIKVFVEGEEEVGSPGLHSLVQQHLQELQCDTMIIADLGNWATGEPALTMTLRGMVGLEVEVRALQTPLHSGLWSGPLPDPAQALSKMLATLSDAQGVPAIDGWMETLLPISPSLAQSWQQIPFQSEQFRQDAGLVNSGDLHGSPADLPERLWYTGTVTVTAMEAGSRQTGGNVLNDSAWARISLRLGPGMDWRHSLDLLEKHLRQHCPWHLELTMTREEGANAWQMDPQQPCVTRMQQALNKAYGKPCQLTGCGASIPGAQIFEELLFPNHSSAPILLTGIEDPQSNAHGENESLDLNDFNHAIQAQIHFMQLMEKG